VTTGTALWIIGIVLMVLGACGIPAGRVSLWNLGWPFVLAAYAFGGIVVFTH
jgi:hypothetical protein